MARRRRAVITAPDYAVQDTEPGFAGDHQAGWVRPTVPCLSTQDAQSNAMELEPTQGLPSEASPLDFDSQPAQLTHWCESDMQVHLNRQPIDVRWVAVCPSMLEHHTRLFLSELTSHYQEQGCGSHLPLPACLFIKRMGGIASVPMDSPSAQLLSASEPNPGARIGQDSTLPGSTRNNTSGGVRDYQGQALMHPSLGVVTNHAGPADKQASSVTLEGMQTHRWSVNYRSTLSGLRRSLESQLATARCTSGPCITVVYLVSPSDEPGIAYSCLAEGALQLSSIKTQSAPDPSPDNASSKQGELETDTPQPQSSIKGDNPASQQHPRTHLVMQVLLPSLLHDPCSQTATQAALSVYSQVLESCQQ